MKWGHKTYKDIPTTVQHHHRKSQRQKGDTHTHMKRGDRHTRTS